MLKWYANVFKLSEKEISRKALNRLKLLTLFSLPCAPLLIMDAFNKIPENQEDLAYITIILSTIALITLCLTKFVNRFWARDKYLDEWETARKHQAMAFAFQVLTHTIGASLFLGVIMSFNYDPRATMVGPISLFAVGAIFFSLLVLFVYLVHFFLLATVKPIDEIPNEGIASVGK